MIIIMAGLPKSGKTVLARQLSSQSKGSFHVDPASFVPPDASPDEHRDAILCGWEIAYEKLLEIIDKNPSNTLIIFDTCASKTSVVETIAIRGKKAGHKIHMVFVETPKEICIKRGADASVVSRYEQQFISSLKNSAGCCDKFTTIPGNRRC